MNRIQHLHQWLSSEEWAGSRLRAGLAILVILFITLYSLEYLAHPWGDREEARNGLLAQGVMEGLVAPVFYYQYQPWAHGPLIFVLVL